MSNHPGRRNRHPNPAFAAHCAPRNNAPIPRQKGCWFEDVAGRRVTTKREYDYIDQAYWHIVDQVYIPTHWAMQHEANARSVPAGTKSKSACPQESGRDVFSTLPAELLTDILRLVLPSGRTFHFSPLGHGRTSVNQLCRKGEPPKIIGRLSLALVCRRLQSIVYDVFYGLTGNNHFVLELSNVPLTSSIAFVPTQFNSTQRPPQSWSRVIRASPSDNEADNLYPFSPRTLRHVAHLTLCISLSSMPISQSRKQKSFRQPADFAQLTQTLKTFSSCLSQGGHSLKSFSLSLDLTRREGSRYYSNILRFRQDAESGRPMLGTYRRGQLSSQEKGIHKAKPYWERCREAEFELSDTVVETACMTTCVVVNEMLAPLLEVRGVREVKTGGILSDAFAQAFEENASRPFESTGNGKNWLGVCEPPRKRLRRV